MAEPAKWYYEVDGEEQGPFAPTEIKRLVRLGAIAVNTPLRRADMAACVAAGTVKGLFPDEPRQDRPAHAAAADGPSEAVPPADAPPATGEEPTGKGPIYLLTWAVAKVLGLPPASNTNLLATFGDAFTRRPPGQLESVLATGYYSAPPINEVKTEWPRPWVFARVLLMGLTAYAVLVWAYSEFQNPKFIPGIILVGTFVAPIATAILVVELNIRRNVSLAAAGMAFLIGGVLSLPITMLGFQIASPLGHRIGAPIAGIVEEPAKLAAVLLVVSLARYRYVHNGMLFGACVGAGFAAFESAGYALEIMLQGLFQNFQMFAQGHESAVQDPIPAMLRNVKMRGLLSPFAHVVWTSLVAGAFWIAADGQPFRWSHFTNSKFLRIAALPVVLHAIWNSSLLPPFLSVESGIYLKSLLLGTVAWCAFLAMYQHGIGQITKEKRAAGASVAGEPTTAVQAEPAHDPAG